MGQHKVEDKSNEVDALPPQIAQLDITDAVVTIDAMGCQKELAKQIQHQKGHYLLAVNKGYFINRSNLFFSLLKNGQ